MKKVHLILIAALVSACSGNQKKGSDQVKSSENLQSDTAPMGYDDMMSQLNNDSSGNKADNPDWQLSVYKDIYPTPKLSKEINDFSALDSAGLKRAYLNFGLVLDNYQDSGIQYLPFFKGIYQALDKQMEQLELAEQLSIRDKLTISKKKSDINTIMATMKAKALQP